MPQETNYELLTNISSSSLPTLAPMKVGDPTATGHAVNRAWLEQYGFTPSALHAPVQTVQNCKDIAAAERVDKMLLLVDDLEALFYFDSSSSETGDDTTIIEPTSGTGRWKALSGGSGGGSSTVQQMILAESVDTTSSPKAGCASQKNCLYVQAADSWLDINETGTEYSTQIVTTNAYFLIHDLGAALIVAGEAPYDLCDVIKTKLNANTDLTLTYNCTYSTTTRKLTYSASSNFAILYNSGTHAGNMLGLGHTETSDKTGASSYTADNPIEDAKEWTQRAFITQTDASYIVKSKNYRGLLTTNGTKGQTATIRLGEQSGFSITAGEKFYTKSARIVIESGVNDALDWKIGAGAEINSTIPAGIYYRGVDSDPLGFRTLNQVLIDTMEADSADNFTWTYDKNVEKFTCVDDSSNTIIFLFGTGTNVASSIGPSLGWSAADTSAAITQTSVNRVEKAGQLGLATDTDVISSTIYAGFSSSPNHMVAEKCGEGYSPIYSVPHDWLTTSTEYDDTQEMQLIDVHFNSQGVGLRAFAAPTGVATWFYKIQRKTPSTPWTTCTTTLAVGTTALFPENFSSGGLSFLRGFIRVDENGHGVFFYAKRMASTWQTECATSTDLDTWGSLTTVGTGTPSFYPAAMAVRENMALCASYDGSNSVLHIHRSTNSGTGYTSWSSTTNGSSTYSDNPVTAHIQYFPSETGVNKHRFIITSGDNPVSNRRYWYSKADFTGSAAGNIFTGTYAVCGASQDSSGTGNRVSLSVVTISGTAYTSTVVQAETNEDYNGGVLTWNTHGSANINSASSAILSKYHGNQTEAFVHTLYNMRKNGVLYGGYNYFFVEDKSNTGSKTAIRMLWSKNVTGGTWESSVVVSTSGDVACTQPQAVYIPASHSILLCWKQDTINTSSYTQGQVYTRLASINGDGTLTWGDITQIDGGEAVANFQGWLMAASWADGAEAHWEHYNGSTRDVLWSNVLA